MEPFPPSSHLMADIRRRLHATILFYDGTPHYCHYLNEDNVTLYPFTLGDIGYNSLVVKYTDPKLTDNIPTLGYYNCPGGAKFVTRLAPRSQRSGLPIEQIYVDSMTVRYTQVCRPEFARMLLNQYPTLQEAWDTARRNQTTVAFSKTYAISNRKLIFHRGKMIGTLKKHPSEPGYYIEYHWTMARHSFYERNFTKRFKDQLERFKEDEASTPW